MITTGEILARNARKFPGREALVFEDRRYTYEELNGTVNRLANALIDMGLDKGEKVVLLSLNSDHFIFSYFAVMKAGGVVVPLNFRLAPPEAKYMLDNCDARFCIVSEEFLPMVREIRDSLPLMEKWIQADGQNGGDFLYLPDLIASGSPSEPKVEVDLFDESAIIYTAGTADRPKGAVFNHYSHLMIAMAMLSELGMRETDRILYAAPLFDSSELHLFLWPGTLVGATHVVAKNFVPEETLGLIEKEKITQFFGAATMYLLMMQVPDFEKYDLSSVRFWSYGAAPMSREQVLKAEEMFKSDNFFCFCGLTEGGPGGVRLRPVDQVRKAGAGGLPIINCESRVIDDNGNDVAPGEMGEWMVRCESNMLHYYKNPDATAEVFTPDGWLRTDDLAVMDEEGYVTLVDRKKEVVVTGGEKVYPREVEMAILENGKVMDAAVVGQPDEIYGETVKAFVVPMPGAELTAGEMTEFCRSRLGDFKIPTSWEFVETLPRNPSGKIQKYMLREF